jgi:hypothetical protein
LALAAVAFAIALAQRPGKASSDTKIDLHVDPAGFLADVAGAWSSTGDLGHVQGGQYGGYLFPMGPFFAALHQLGASAWLTQRLWLGTILALAAWGAVKLMDELNGRPRTRAHAVAGLLMLLNPYVVVFSARTTVTLLGYAALPWLLVAVRRGIRANPTWWAAAFALIVTASGGGVNAAVTAWMLVGPILLAAYERWQGSVTTRAIARFAVRAVAATALVSAWWVMPLLVQSRYGVDFLRFTEQPGTIWSTTSLPESLRLMGYWISYLGVGYGGALRPYFGDGGVLLFALPVVIAGLLTTAVALTGFAWTRRHPYGPFALLLVLAGLLIMVAGFPEGTPLRRASNFTYNHFLPVQFLRTTYKAGPLVVVGLAVLAGLAAQRVTRRPLLAAALILPLVASWPLIRGRAVDDQLLWDEIPAAWTQAANHVDAQEGRALVLPGQLYAYYDWGGTIDPILPVLAGKPVATRNAVGYADLRATDLEWTTDALVQQRRALPGQLDPLLDLMGARTVIQGADEDRTRSGAAPPAEAADSLAQLGEPDAAWGATRARPRAAGTLGAPVELPQVRAWDRPGAPGLVRVAPQDPETIVDGSAEGVAAAGVRGDFTYAADATPDQIHRARRVVITDSNRRRIFVASRLVQNTGPVLAADEEPSVDAAVLDPFGKGSDAQTVAVYGGGIKGVSAPSSPGYPQFPENRPFAALDGDPATHWQADRALTPDRHVLTVTFAAPRDVPFVDLEPYDDSRVTVTAVEIAGRRHAVHQGVNRLRLGLRGVGALSVRIIVEQRPGPTITAGIRELAIPGVAATEALRLPVIAERAVPGPTAALTYVFQRTTGDDPFRRDPWHGPSSSALVRDRGDGETGLERLFSPPAARTWRMDGWVTTTPHAPDAALDAFVGVRGTFHTSARFQGRPGFRASSAFDGTPTPWIGSWQDGRRVWIEWVHPATLRELTLEPVPGVRRATRVRLRSEDAVSPPIDVGPGGVVRLPRPIAGRRFRLEILRSAFPAGTPGVQRQRRAVGIAELRGTGVPRVEVPRAGSLSPRCTALGVSVGGKTVGLAVAGTIADLDAGRPLRVHDCEGIALPAGPTRLSAPPGPFTPYVLRLRSGESEPSPPPGRVLAAGTATRGGRKDVRLAMTAPGRLMLAESYNRGRRASCDGRDLGAPTVGGGFGTAWRVPATCRNVTIAFAPNRLVNAGYAVSALVAALLLALLVLGRRRLAAADEGGAAEDERAATPGGAAPMPARRAALVAVVVGLAFGFVFAARATPLFALGVFFVLYRGIGAKPLALAGGAVLGVAVPVLTLIVRPENRGGYNPEYAIDRIAVHWVAVVGVALFVLALSRAMGRPARGRGAPPSDDARPRPAP